jgi:hypothetical protein
MQAGIPGLEEVNLAETPEATRTVLYTNGSRRSRIDGGPGRDRTDDLFHAMEARSQLRHRPTLGDNFNSRPRVSDSQTP